MLVLVTGGAGFIGSHVVDLLLEHGLDVRVVDSLCRGADGSSPSYLSPTAEYRWGDLTDATFIRSVVAGVDAVSHQAAMVGLGRNFQDIDAFVHNNDVGTATLLRALHDECFRGRFVLASSMVVYGEGRYCCPSHGLVMPGPRSSTAVASGDFDHRCPRCHRHLTPQPTSEEAPTRPNSIYAATKLHQEHLCAAFAAAQGISVTALRYHNVYGPRMPRHTPYAGVASIFRSDIEAGRSPRILEDGRQQRDFIHVHDIARANYLALIHERPWHGPLNIATGSPRTISDLATLLCQTYDPMIHPHVVGGTRPGDVRHVLASPYLARDQLGYSAEIDLEVGLSRSTDAELHAEPL